MCLQRWNTDALCELAKHWPPERMAKVEAKMDPCSQTRIRNSPNGPGTQDHLRPSGGPSPGSPRARSLTHLACITNGPPSADGPRSPFA